MKSSIGIKKHPCSECQYVGATGYHLTRHFKAVHHNPEDGDKPVELRQFPCSLCQYVAKRKGHLKRHVVGVHLSRLLPENELKFQCDECDYKTPNKYHLARHKEGHEVIVYRCEHCEYAAKRKDTIKLHVNLKHK